MKKIIGNRVEHTLKK